MSSPHNHGYVVHAKYPPHEPNDQTEHRISRPLTSRNSTMASTGDIGAASSLSPSSLSRSADVLAEPAAASAIPRRLLGSDRIGSDRNSDPNSVEVRELLLSRVLARSLALAFARLLPVCASTVSKFVQPACCAREES